jgi:YD repeat-containing protein
MPGMKCRDRGRFPNPEPGDASPGRLAGGRCRADRLLGVGGALLLALAWLVALVGLVACSGLGALPTLAPTLALPTAPRPSATSAAPVTPLPPTPTPALVLSYRPDPATGQMVPVERLSGVTVPQSDQLWVMTKDAFVEYHRQGTDELVAHKVITYTYDEIGRRVGWTVSWPQGPTQTQRLIFLYEGLVAVGEQLRVGDMVTTTYYAWATKDRNTTLGAPLFAADAPITDVTRYDARCQAAAELDCVTMTARIIVSEASVGNEDEQRAVAWTFRNRLDRGLSLLSYAMDGTPNREWYFELAREVLTAAPEADVTKGATHFFSPRSMPLQGEEARCKGQGGIYDCDGGLVFVEGLPAPAYAPFWHLLYEWLPVPGIRKTHFLFYRIPPIRPRMGEG